ncbi:hypothetical protein GSS87_03430 [Corynebacterium sp. 4HC-13]|uniref:metallopeptidase family protein n=1 Tax=Corynebacterium anserum TaxID=2684406 RepID=UPI001639695E|nr:metallopeptidase family protein [Corynebacterium anserum]MBC2681457.1 hypothetical protein [Corynebacterium anserum]
MALYVTEEEFDELVDLGLQRIPREILRHVTNVAIVVEDANSEDPTILGLYEGVALTDRTSEYTSILPDKISIYRQPLCEMAADRTELVEQVAITVIHELAHHFGIDDERLHELGWA